MIEIQIKINGQKIQGVFERKETNMQELATAKMHLELLAREAEDHYKQMMGNSGYAVRA